MPLPILPSMVWGVLSAKSLLLTPSLEAEHRTLHCVLT